MAAEKADLLFFDTFSHDASEELNLDLVQFPKSVFVTEIRIIPLGARVEGDFPGGVRLGATNPTKFHIDFFVNDLGKPGACTFEALGSLDYCQNGQIHMECSTDVEQARIPTDGLVLRGCYTTITLAVYGHLTQVLPETPSAVNAPPNIQRPVSREVAALPAIVPKSSDWSQDGTNPIPSYTSNVAAANPENYDATTYPENYENPMYRSDFYENNEQPKDPRTYHHLEDNDWEKERHDLTGEREPDRSRHSPRSMELDRERRDVRSRRRSLDPGRSRETSRHRDHSQDIDRMDRLSRSRSRDREYGGKGEYRMSRSRSRSLEPDWDRGTYKKDDYRRRGPSYERSRGDSFERSPYDKRAPSYERKVPYDKAPYDKRGSSYERRGPSPYGKRHSPYRVRGSSYGSRSPSRDDSRKRPRTPTGGRPLSPREGEGSPINSLRSEDGEYDRSGKQIPRVDFYHQSYRHKTSIRSPSQEGDNTYVEQQHSSLVTVPIVDNALKSTESPVPNNDDKSMDGEQFEPILSDEDICDDLEGSSYMDAEYDANEYDGADDVIKYFNPFKDEWKKYQAVNKIYLLPDGGALESKNVLTATFHELCEVCADLYKMYEITKSTQKRDQKFFSSTFPDIDNACKEEWVHLCEQLFVCLTNLCKHTDIILRIFRAFGRSEQPDQFHDIYNMFVTFCKIGLNFQLALSHQQPTYKIRHMKCGIRLAEALTAHRHNGQVMKLLLGTGIDIPMSLLQIYSKEYMALSIRLMILKALNACLSSKVSMDHFMQEAVFPKFNKSESDSNRKAMNGYRALICMMESNPLARIKFSISALIKKLNVYEVLGQLHDVVSKHNPRNENEDSFEADTDLIVHSLEEILFVYRTQSFHLSQPKRFLPASAQFEINKECSNRTLLEFFSEHRFLESCLFLLTSPFTCNNSVITCRIHDIIHEMINSHDGLLYLYKNMASSEIFFKVLTHPYSQQGNEETSYPHDSNLSNYSELQVIGLELAYRLKALYYLESISDIQAGKEDDNELIDRLQHLYCLSFGSVGKTAVPDVIVMGDSADCLMSVFEYNLKGKGKSESPSKQKSPAKGYAIELVVSAIRYSANVQFLKKYGQRLANVCKDHDRFEPSVSSVLQEAIPYLKPIEKPAVLSGEDLVECVDILKNSLEHSPDLPGELMTCLRILRHFCVSDYDSKANIVCESPTEEYVELKYKYNVLQLFSLDGVANLASILDKLATHFEQPSMHTSFFASVKGLQLAQILLPCLRLLDEMISRVVRCRGPRFRDITAAPILLKTYGLAKSYPIGCIGHRTATLAAEAAVRALLAYAQPIADDAKDGDSIRRGPWTSLCSEVISYTMTAPYTFVPGLLVFSELLPLPLPIQTKVPPSDRELADASNERRLWSAHLHALTTDLTDMIQIICMSTYRPVVHMLRRVCIQIADLAPNTAATVAKAAVGAVVREIKEGEPASANMARVLGFLACLVSHAPVKCAVVHGMSNGPKANALQLALCGLLSCCHASSDHAAAQEYAAHTLAALCDAEVTLTPVTAAGDTVLANSLPNREALNAFLDAAAQCLGSATKSGAVASSILRSYYVLTEHDYGFQHFRKCVAKQRDCFGKFFRWVAEGASEDKAECLNLYMDLIKVLRSEEGVGPLGRKGVLTLTDVADMIGYTAGAEDHPIVSLEKTLKERNADEEATSNAHFLYATLQKLSEAEASFPSTDPPEPELVPEPLVSQFGSRQVYTLDCSDERLTSAYWLNVPVSGEDDVNDTELVPCDVLEMANSYLSAGGGEALVSAVRRLAGCLDTRPDPMQLPADDKRPAVALSRVRGEGGADAFRSRPPNTSRPPSLHVDDFTALHQPYAPNTRGARRGAAPDRGRFASAAPHQHYRQLRGRGAWEMGAQHFGHFPPAQYMMGGMGWGGGRMQRGPRHRSFMR